MCVLTCVVLMWALLGKSHVASIECSVTSLVTHPGDCFKAQRGVCRPPRVSILFRKFSGIIYCLPLAYPALYFNFLFFFLAGTGATARAPSTLLTITSCESFFLLVAFL